MDNLDTFDKRFSTDEACKAFLVAKRWPDGVRCPRCNSAERIYALKARPFHWVCKSGETSKDVATGKPVICDRKNGYRFSVLSHTIFQDTKVPLKLWFKIGYLMITAKKGMSSLQMRRVIFGEKSGTDWRTCWYICHRWRSAMHGDLYPMGGIVEADETHIGGKDRNRHWNKRSAQLRAAAGPQKFGEAVGYGKVGVIGAIERKGNVVARVIGDTDARTLDGFVRQVTSDKVSLVVTDEAPSYMNLGRPHASVTHSHNEYVRGNIHTNNIESFWALLKRGVVGTYHKVSRDYLPLYLNEFSFRFNNRDNPDMFDDLITTCGR